MLLIILNNAETSNALCGFTAYHLSHTLVCSVVELTRIWRRVEISAMPKNTTRTIRTKQQFNLDSCSGWGESVHCAQR